MGQSVATTEIYEILEALEALMADNALGLNVLDPLTSPRSAPSCLIHKGVGVALISDTNTRQYREREKMRLEAQIRILLAWRIKPKDQKASQRAAHVANAELRQAVTDLSHERRWHPSLIRTQQEIHSSEEWLLLDNRYRFAHDVIVGGG